jgi:hypothetical protein
MALLLPWNAQTEERTREQFFVKVVDATTASNSLKATKLKAELAEIQQHLNSFSASVPRWLKRKHTDLNTQKQKVLEKLKEVQLDKQTVRANAEAREAHYASLFHKLKTNPKQLVTQSAHSVLGPQKIKKNSVVVVSRENVGELLRQKFRAELGLQELPLMITAGDVCDDCGLSMLVVSNDSMLTCPQCHKMRVLPNTMSSNNLQDSDPASIITKHRFTEWLEFMQAKDVCTPPAEVLSAVGRYLLDNRMTGLEEHAQCIADERRKNGPFKDIEDAEQRLPGLKIYDCCKALIAKNPSLIRGVLKTLVMRGDGDKFRKFYERSVKITALLTGFWPPRLTGSQEEIMRMLFCAAAPYYEKERKPKTTTWPGGFPYFLRSLCILLGWDEFAQQFPVANSSINASRDALRSKIWSRPEMDWECVPYTGVLPPIRLSDGTLLSTVLQDNGDVDDDEHTPRPKPVKKRARPASHFEFA